MAKDPICNMEIYEKRLKFKSQMEAKHTIFAPKNVKKNLNCGLNCISRHLTDRSPQLLHLATAGLPNGIPTCCH